MLTLILSDMVFVRCTMSLAIAINLLRSSNAKEILSSVALCLAWICLSIPTIPARNCLPGNYTKRNVIFEAYKNFICIPALEEEHLGVL
jgi:hypothetical protein